MNDFSTLLGLLPTLIYPLLSLFQFTISKRAVGRPGGTEMMYGSGIMLISGLAQVGAQYMMLTDNLPTAQIGMLFSVVGMGSMIGIAVFLVGLSRFVTAARGQERSGGNMLDRY